MHLCFICILCVSRVHSILLLTCIPLYSYTAFFKKSTYLFIEKTFGLFPLLLIMNNAPIDIYIQVFFMKISFHFSRVSTEIWLARSSGKCIFDFFPANCLPPPERHPISIRSTATSGNLASKKLPKIRVLKLKKGKKYFSKTVPKKIIS